MDLKKFYEDVKDIVLYPGSLNELNMIEQARGDGLMYELLPQEGSVKYIIGTIIPSPSECEEIIGIMDGFLDDAADLMNGLEEMVMELYGENVIDADIRMKAKKIGANGLIHVRLYNTDGIYMGVPVKIKK